MCAVGRGRGLSGLRASDPDEVGECVYLTCVTNLEGARAHEVREPGPRLARTIHLSAFATRPRRSPDLLAGGQTLWKLIASLSLSLGDRVCVCVCVCV